jgi:hypothetical protein
MWPKRKKQIRQIAIALENFSRTQRQMPGIIVEEARQTLAMQMVASCRRIDYTNIIRSRAICRDRADPESPLFDPERAAILHARAGRFDEAIWLIFLATHFGKHSLHGWRLLHDVYSGLGVGVWSWERVSTDPTAFREWLRANRHLIGGAFGNHRKYESLSADSPAGTAAVVESYVGWIGPDRSHSKRFAELVRAGGNHPHNIFDHIYKSFKVARFGRLGKLDFLCLLGRLDLAPIEPGSVYLTGATGPLRGARLLFGGNPVSRLRKEDLDDWIRELDVELEIGMQAMEDSLCNWQKSPMKFIHFRG